MIILPVSSREERPCLQEAHSDPAGPGPGSESDARSNGAGKPSPFSVGNRPAVGDSAANGCGGGGVHADRDGSPSDGSGNPGGGGGEPGGGGSEDEQLLLAGHLVDFWTNICVCHSLIVEDSEDGEVHFQVRDSGQVKYRSVPSLWAQGCALSKYVRLGRWRGACLGAFQGV